VGKEQIAGLMVALQNFVEEGDEVRHARWSQLMVDLATGIGELSDARVDVHLDRPVPILQIRLSDIESGIEVVKQLMAGEPSVHVNTAGVYEGVLGVSPICLSRDQVPQIASQIQKLLR
jgi:L-seryl-tRNA(Ser) seleniumtransferase